jgi:hypothetical protein
MKKLQKNEKKLVAVQKVFRYLKYDVQERKILLSR